MKALSRDFSAREKVLIVILLLILLGLAYYRFVHIPCTEAVQRARSEKSMYESDLLAVQRREAQMRTMKEELDGLGELQSASRMESYNNSKGELSLLNRVLEPASDYSISFASVTRDGDQIRRNFDLEFNTNSFDSAKNILKNLADSEYRCLIGDIQYTVTLRRAKEDEPEQGGKWVKDVYYFTVVKVTANATFFETMYDGVPDAGLPVDKAAS